MSKQIKKEHKKAPFKRVFRPAFLYLLLLIVIVMTLSGMLYQAVQREKEYGMNISSVLYYNDFNKENEGTYLSSFSEWNIYTSIKEVKKSPYWFYSTNALYKQYFIPGDYSDEKSQYLNELAITGNNQWNNYVYLARIQPEDANDVGIVFRYLNSTHFYYVTLSKDNKSNTIIYKLNKKQGTTSKILGQFTTTDKEQNYTNTWEQIGVIANRNHLQIYKNSNLIISVDDGSYLNGKIGFYALPQTSAYFDDMKVDRIQ